jgi:hypothetical protein
MPIDQGNKEELSINHVVKKQKLHQSCDKHKVSINHVVTNKRYQSIMLLQTKVINQSCDKQKLQINKGEYDKCKLSINQGCDN